MAKKFEYLVKDYNCKNVQVPKHGEELNKFLKSFEKDSWELISVVKNSNYDYGTYCFFFKR